MHCAQYFLFSPYAFSRKLMYRFDNCRPAIVLLCCLDRKNNNIDFLHFFIAFHLHYFIIALYQKYTALIFHLRGPTTKLYGRYPRKLPNHFAGEIIITYLMAFWRNLWPTSTLLISNWWYDGCFVCAMPLLWTLYTYKAHRKSSGFFYSVVFVSRGFTSSVLSVAKNSC